MMGVANDLMGEAKAAIALKSRVSVFVEQARFSHPSQRLAGGINSLAAEVIPVKAV